MKKYDSEIDSIIENFDFEKVHEVMTMLNWRWGIPDSGEFAVPKMTQLILRARSLIVDAIDYCVKTGSKECHTGTGGFGVDVNFYDDTEKPYIKLVFVLTEWNNYD